MPNLIEWLDSVCNTGKDLTKDEPELIKEFAPFPINNGLSQHMDTVLIANEMNKRPWISKDMQYKFFLHAISKKKRFGKWAKVEVPDNQEQIDIVSEFYNINKIRAAEYLPLIPPQEIEYMKKRNDMGGCDLPKGKKK